MTAEASVHATILQYPALEEVLLQVLDTNLRARIMDVLILSIRQAQHEERRVCARLALEYLQATSDPACQALAEEIATEILARDTEA